MSGIFINYRRSDSPDATDRIYDRLVAEFGRATVFKDIDSIPLGRDFRSHLSDMVGNCAVVLAVVGPHWTEVRDETGERRLEDADDFVRIELEAALARNIPVVPVLVSRALMPASAQLPASLAPLSYRQSIEVRPDPDFHNDSTRLVVALRRILDPTATVIDEEAASRDVLRLRRLVWTIAAVAVAGMIAFAIPAIRHLREAPLAPPPETRTEIVTPATTQPTSFALSPDGRHIVYVASGDGASRLWLRALAATTAQPLAGTEGARFPFWSPDSRSIAFFAAGSLKRLDLGGGAPQTLTSASIGRGGTWGADGVILFAPYVSGPLMRVAASGGAPTAVAMAGLEQLSLGHPHFLPDGRQFLFFVRGSPEQAGLYLASLDSSAPTRLTPADSAGVYLPGWLLWVRAGTLLAQRLDLAQAALTGEPQTLADGVGVDAFFRSAVSATPTGLVAYRTATAELRRLTWFDRSGTARGSVGDVDGSYSLPRVSPDGRRVIVERLVQGNRDLWLLDGARMSRFTNDAAADSYPVWSPDGTRIAFRSARSGAGNIYQKRANGAGTEELLLESTEVKAPSSWSADGRFLLYGAAGAKFGGDIGMLPMIGDHTPALFLQTPFGEGAGMFSPDGRWVAYMSNESGRAEIYVRPFVPPGAAGPMPVSDDRWQVSTAGGLYPRWRPDGREIYYLNPEGAMMAAPIRVTGATLEPGAPVRLFATRIAFGGTEAGQGRQYDVAPDGRFLINTDLEHAAAPITLIQHWNAEGSSR